MTGELFYGSAVELRRKMLRGSMFIVRVLAPPLDLSIYCWIVMSVVDGDARPPIVATTG